MIRGGDAAGQAIEDAYVAQRYHQPTDEWQADWDLSGPVEDTEALYTVGERLANSVAWPNFYPDSEFRPLHDKVMRGGK